jgi:uncharacterized Zn finger protein
MCWCDPQKRTPWCDNCKNTRPAKPLVIKAIKAEELTFVCPDTKVETQQLLLERGNETKKLIRCLSCGSFHSVDLSTLTEPA